MFDDGDWPVIVPENKQCPKEERHAPHTYWDRYDFKCGGFPLRMSRDKAKSQKRLPVPTRRLPLPPEREIEISTGVQLEFIGGQLANTHRYINGTFTENTENREEDEFNW